jgi:benzoate 4-monooxygenase
MADTRSKEEHRSKRKRMAHIFSQKSIAQLGPLIAERVDCLFQQVLNAAQSSSSINIRRYVNYFIIDVITAIMFGQTARTLEQGSDNVRAETIDGKT